MRQFLLCLSLGVVCLVAPLGVRADDTEEFLKPDNWVGRSDLWTIKGTSIVGETTEDPKYNTFFASKALYGDFELSFDCTLRDGVGNSGVQIRSTLSDKEKFVVKGPQVDVGKGYWGSLYGEGVGGMMKQTSGDQIKKLIKEDGVNRYKIVAKGSKISIEVNGEMMIDEEFATMPNKKPTPADGVIAFQVHAGYPKMRVEFANIKFKVLK